MEKEGLVGELGLCEGNGLFEFGGSRWVERVGSFSGVDRICRYRRHTDDAMYVVRPRLAYMRARRGLSGVDNRGPCYGKKAV